MQKSFASPGTFGTQSRCSVSVSHGPSHRGSPPLVKYIISVRSAGFPGSVQQPNLDIMTTCSDCSYVCLILRGSLRDSGALGKSPPPNIARTWVMEKSLPPKHNAHSPSAFSLNSVTEGWGCSWLLGPLFHLLNLHYSFRLCGQGNQGSCTVVWGPSL